MRSRTTQNRNRRRHRQGRRQATVALVVNRLYALPDELHEVIQSYVRFTPAFLKAVVALYERDKEACLHRHGNMHTWDLSWFVPLNIWPYFTRILFCHHKNRNRMQSCQGS